MAIGPGSLTAWNVAPGGGDVDLKRKMAFALLQQGMDTSPKKHWTQALAQAVQGAMGGGLIYDANQEDEADKAASRSIISALSGGTQTIPQPPVQQAPVDPTAPRGYRNNNPLNIESGSFTQGQPGYQGSDGRFARFASLDQGQAAADRLLQVYGGKGINTVGGVVNRWAPPSDNNPTNAYAATVAKAVGVSPDQPIDLNDPGIRQKIIMAMAQFENGKPMPTAPVGAPVDQPRGGLTDDRRSQLIQSLMQTRSGAPIGQALFAKELDREAGRTRPLTEQEKQIYPGAVAIKASGDPVFPPPSTNVSLNAQNSAESAYSKGKAEDALTLERSADSTLAERQRLEVFKSLVDGFKTGKLAPAQSTVGAWADALGIDATKLGLPKNAAIDGQLIESMSNQMTLGMIGNKGGEGGMPANNFSDADRKFLAATAPGLSRMQGGNQILAEMKGRALDRQLDKIAMWDQYRSEGKKYEDFERDWRKKIRSEPSLFADIPDRIKALSGESGGAATNPASSPNDGWTDLGNGVRIREKK